MNLEVLEQYAKDNLGIPNVNFSELDVAVAKEIVAALDIIMQRYPALKNTICAIGENEDINNQYNLLNNSSRWKKGIQWEDFVNENGATLSSISIGTHIPLIKGGNIIELKSFIAISYGEHLKDKNIEELNMIAKKNAELGFHPQNCTTFRSVVFHEIGHVLDFVMGFSHSRKFFEMISEKSNGFKNIQTCISEYALSAKLDDVIAEAFAEYMVNPSPNELVSSIGKYIDEKYKKYENSRIFKINEKFKGCLSNEEKMANNKIM